MGHNVHQAGVSSNFADVATQGADASTQESVVQLKIKVLGAYN